jgi:hypothetical protein
VASSLQLVRLAICIHFSFCHVCYILHPSHPPWLDRPNDIWWRVQITKLQITQFSQSSSYFLLVTSQYSPQDPVLKSHHCVHFLQVHRRSFTHTNKIGKVLFGVHWHSNTRHHLGHSFTVIRGHRCSAVFSNNDSGDAGCPSSQQKCGRQTDRLRWGP